MESAEEDVSSIVVPDYNSKPPNLVKSSLAKPIFSDCLEKGQALKSSDYLSYLANVPRYTVPPPAHSEPIACLFGSDVGPTVPPAFLLDT
ncbi:hypothetical protein E2C01_036668 [Portunus trituberculatus]|uniref:Uncharacterized protein n=1 Tax=Portunus trituberculatus TaxID=210409 RepID=A0A5B7FD37_PORTR|nr:hypothetical protein [Portunus trituberculatus]